MLPVRATSSGSGGAAPDGMGASVGSIGSGAVAGSALGGDLVNVGAEEPASQAGPALRAPSSRPFRQADNLAFDWPADAADCRLRFHFTRKIYPGPAKVAWMVQCPFHHPQVPWRSSVNEPLPCTRELGATGLSQEATDACVRVLKAWCVRCDEFVSRNTHMGNVSHHRWHNGVAVLPTDDELDDKLAAVASRLEL